MLLYIQDLKRLLPVAMDSGKMCLLLLILAQLICAVMGHLVFEVHHKYGRRAEREAELGAMRTHDLLRRGRMLAAIDFELGGHGLPTNESLYFTKITIGTPPVDYHVQVDTGSDFLWVNCHDCESCPTKSDLGIKFQRYDLAASSTGKMITCDEDFCDAAFSSPNTNCQAGRECEYSVTYADGSETGGHFVRDTFRFDQLTGNLQTSTMNSSIAFGCSVSENPSKSVDGIVGLGRGNASILSQLASSGRVKRVFSHCLNGNMGGGIFAVGEVVDPKVNRTPLVPNERHYNVNLKSVKVGGQLLNLSSNLSSKVGSSRETIIDSGANLAFLPSDVYHQLFDKMMLQHPDLRTRTERGFECFEYGGNVDDGFPIVNFHFEDSLVLPVHPHSYLFKYSGDEYCIGWQNSNTLPIDEREITLLGDIVLFDKLVLYDLENQSIGWIEYNCSSSIRVRDEASGSVYGVGSHDISAASQWKWSFMRIIILVLVAIHSSSHYCW